MSSSILQDPLAPMFHLEAVGMFHARRPEDLPDLWATGDKCHWILTLKGAASVANHSYSHRLTRGWVVVLSKPPLQHLKPDFKKQEPWSGLFLCASNLFSKMRMEHVIGRFGSILEISATSLCARLARRLAAETNKDEWARAALAFGWFYEWWKMAEQHHSKTLRLLSSRITAKHFAQEPISLKNLAAQLGYSPCYLSGELSRNWGEKPSLLLRRERLKLAVQQLVETDISVEVLAHELGYQSPSSFIRLFRQTHGLPPGKYRAAHSSKA